MHVALIIDEERLRFEREWFNRTVVGLLSSGARITRVLPEGEPNDPRVALAPAVWYRARGMPWDVRGRRVEAASQLAASPPDVIHALGSRCWDMAIDLGQRLECPVALDVWSPAEVPLATRAARVAVVSGLFAATDPLAEALKQKANPALIQVVPIGVHLRSQPRQLLEHRNESVAAVVAGNAATFAAIRPLIDGFSQLRHEFPQLMLFADLSQSVADQTWKLVKALELQSNLSMIASAEEHRELVLDADLLLVPTVGRSAGTFMLEALGRPMAVLAVEDPLIDVIAPGRSRLLQVSAGAMEWESEIRSILEFPDEACAMGTQAREFIAESHPMSRQIQVLFDSYERIISGDTLAVMQ